MTDDEQLIASIDNELDDRTKAALAARLANDAALRSRYETLRRSRDDIASALGALLDRAPVARLSATLPPPAAAPLPRRARFGWIGLAAAFFIGAVVAGAAVFMAAERGESESAEDWRSAVIEYAKLYTADTFAFPAPDNAAQAKQLQAVGEKLGLELTPEKVDVKGLAYKIAVNFAFAGKPLAEIAYTDDKGEPALFCVMTGGDGVLPPRPEKRDGFSTASWSRDGKSYMVVARQPQDRVTALAETLAARF